MKFQLMPLNDDERKYLDEKFSTLHKRIDAAFAELKAQREEHKRITDLEIEMSKRPTTYQLLSACTATFALGLAAAGFLMKVFA